MPSPKTLNRCGPGWRGPRFLRQARARRLLLEMTGQLADLVRLRVPLGDGIAAMALDAPDRKLRALLFVLSLDLKSGLSLHESLARRPRFFPAAYVDAVRVGEETGRLGTVLDRLEDSLLQTGRFQDALAGHLFYLKAILLSVLLVGTMATVELSSEFEAIYASFRCETPWLMQTHHPLTAIPPWGVVGGILLLALVLTWLTRRISLPSGKPGLLGRLSWRTLMHVPWVGGFYRARDLAHVAQQLDTLTWAGLPLDKALDDVASGSVSPAMSAALARMGKAVRGGISLDAALGREKIRRFPHTFRGLVQLGGQAGALPESLGQLALIYRSETLNRARMLLNVGAPLGVCCVGAYVFLVCRSFYGVIFAISGLVTP